MNKTINMGKKLTLLVSCFLLISSSQLWAGSKASQDIKFKPDEIKKFIKQVEMFAATNRAMVFIIARVGQPEKSLPEGVSFTHTALAVYSSIELETGEVVKGYAIHNLYQLDSQPDKSSLVVDYPVDFFWGADSLKAGIIIPTENLQRLIVDVLLKKQNYLLHNRNYSVISNPFNSQFQNCTEHTLDIINAAVYQTIDVDQIKKNTQAHFKPERIKINPVSRLFGNLLMKDFTTHDHSRRIYTTTFSTIAKYLNMNSLIEKAVIIQKDEGVKPFFKS